MSVIDIVQTVALIVTSATALTALWRAQRDRSAELQRERLERLVSEILRLLDAVTLAANVQGQGAAVAIARVRLEATIAVAGGAGRWSQADILLRAPNESAPDQAKAALLEVTSAIAAL